MQPGLAPRQADARDVAVRAAARRSAPTRRSRSARPSTSARSRRRTSRELGAGLPPDVDVMWTGPTVCSPTLRADDARGWTDALGGHRTIVWDNTPVNDATMTHELHLGPYLGREPEPRRRGRRRAVQSDDAAARVAGPARDRDGVPRATPTATTRPRRGPAPSPMSARDARATARRARPRVRRRAAGRRPGTLELDPARRRAGGRARRARLGRRRVRDARRRAPRSPGPCRRVPAADADDDPLAPSSPRGRRRRAPTPTAGLAALRLIQQVSRPSRPGRRGRPGPGRSPPDPEPRHAPRLRALLYVDGRACR